MGIDFNCRDMSPPTVIKNPLQEWLAARRSALVEVRNHDGRNVMVARSAYTAGAESPLGLNVCTVYFLGPLVSVS